MTELRCKRCGCPHVRWMQTNAGKWYLAVKPDLETADAEARAYAHVARKRPHRCLFDESACRESRAWRLAQELAADDAYQASLSVPDSPSLQDETSMEALALDAEADGGWDADAAYERYLEDGGPHALAIAAEDEYERDLEAQDVGLQEMRAARERWTCAVDGCEIGGVGAHQDAYERIDSTHGRLSADRWADRHHDAADFVLLDAAGKPDPLLDAEYAQKAREARVAGWSEAEKRYAWGDR